MAKDPLEGFKPPLYNLIVDDGKRDKNGQEKYFYLANVGISKTFSDLDPAHPVYAVQLLINKFPVACDDYLNLRQTNTPLLAAGLFILI